MSRSLRSPALVLVPLVLAAWVYLPLRGIWFFADDLMHLLDLVSDPAWTFLLRPFGGHNYLLRNLVFLVSYEAFGLRASLYYWTMLLTHLLNVGLLFGVLQALSGSAWLACLGAALWGTSPLVSETLGWYSAYGQVLATTILLACLLGLVRTHGALRPAAALAYYFLILAGTTCYGIGVGVALVFPVVLFLLVPSAWQQPRLRGAYLALPVVTLAVYFAFRRLYPLIEPLTFAEQFQEGVARGGFGSVPTMLLELLRFSVAGCVLGYFGRATTHSGLAVAVYAGLLGVLAWRGGRRAHRVALAMALVAVAMYGLVAVGRASMYAVFKIPPRTAAATLRYHYAGTIPVTILLALALQQLGRLRPLRSVPRPLAVAALLLLAGWGYERAGSPVPLRHEDAREYFLRTMLDVTARVRATPPGATVYLENLETPRYVLGPGLGPNDFPGRAAVFFLATGTDTLEGHPLRFIEHSEDVLAYWHARRRNRFPPLLVSPESVPPSARDRS